MDLILKNANVLTMDPTHSRAAAVAVKWGKIFRIGKDKTDAHVLMTTVAGKVVYEAAVSPLEHRGLIPDPFFTQTHTSAS